MTDDATFIRAIQDNPNDDSIRLVYADWLEERGDSRGEYLRLAGRLAELRQHIDESWLAAVRGGTWPMQRIRLRSGWVISLLELRQFRVYEGREGIATHVLNEHIISRILEEERGQLYSGEPYLIPPIPKPIPYYRRDQVEIPEIGCVGRFHCSQPVKHFNRSGSRLLVVWFQDEFALPINPQVWEQLLAIDWEQHAADGWWPARR
jgi:uncharacterized protein (TIGR02996 family)